MTDPTTATVHHDAPILGGNPGRVLARFTPSVALIWADTGTPLALNFDAISPANGEPMAIDLPHTNQTGFVDAAGNAVTGWHYNVRLWYFTNGQESTFPPHRLSVPVTKTDVDLGLINFGTPVTPAVATPNAGGQTGPAGPAGPAGLDGADSTVPGPQGPAGGPSGFSMISGQYATFNPGNANTTNSNLVARVQATPIYLPEPMSIIEIRIRVDVAVEGSSFALGYYTNEGSLFTKQADFGTVASDTIGDKVAAVDITLPAGVLWFAWLSLGGGASFRATSSIPPWVPGPHLGVVGLLASSYVLMVGPSAQSSLPDTFTGNGLDNISQPMRFIGKVA